MFYDLPDKDSPFLQNTLSRPNAYPANCASTLLMCYFFADVLDTSRTEIASNATMEKVAHLTSLASRVAVSTDGFSISTDSFSIPISSAGMVSGFQTVCRQHHNWLAESIANQWFQMKEDGFRTVIWSDDRELPFRDLVVFVMCAKRSRKNHRAKKWGTMITNFLHLLTIAVMKCLADVAHAHMWQNLGNFTNKDIPIRSIKCPAQNDSICVCCWRFLVVFWCCCYH